jgi:hypothetical protein
MLLSLSFRLQLSRADQTDCISALPSEGGTQQLSIPGHGRQSPGGRKMIKRRARIDSQADSLWV